MHKLNIDFNDFFGPTTAKRGFDYFKGKKVFHVELNKKDSQLNGTVRGAKNKTYQVEVGFSSFGFDEGLDPIEGFCECPVGYNCKHVCALLLAAESKYGADSLNKLMGFSGAAMDEDNPHDHEGHQRTANMLSTIESMIGGKKQAALFKKIENSLKGSSPGHTSFGITNDGTIIKPPSDTDKQTTLNRETRNWLNNLKKVAGVSEPDQQVQPVTKSGNSCVVYILDFDHSGEIVAGIHLSRYLKKGGFGKPGVYRSVYNCLHNNNWPASMADSDKHIVKLAYLHRLINEYYGEISLSGEHGLELLNKIEATSRCLVDSERMIPVHSGKKLKGEVRWVMDESGFQRSVLYESTTDHRINLLPTEPARYFKVMRETAEYGELTGLPDTPVLSALLKAPPLDEAAVEATAKALPSLIKGKGQKSIQIPKTLQTLMVEPKAALVLDGIPSGENKKNSEMLARARLFFSYNEQRIEHNSTESSLHSDTIGHQVIPRQEKLEKEFRYDLPINMRPAYMSWSSGASDKNRPVELKDNDLIMGLSGADYRRDWLYFMSEELPELEDQGWIIEMDDSFPFRFETLSEDDWYAELDESETDWFTLRLGINIDGKSIDLLPLLARQINQLPTPDELKKMPKDALVPVALPGGRFVNLPAERLRLIAGTLIELFGDRPLEEYRLQNHHAELWQELHDQLGLPWAGGEKLLALGKKLKTFKRLKKAKPAKQLDAKLRPYQQDGLSWLQFLREYGLNGILADDMGLGKTIQTLAHLQLEKQRLGNALPPSLVVSPTSLIHNWKNEAKRFTPDLKVHIHHGAQRDSEAIDKADLVLTSYGIIQRDFEQLSQKKFHLLALDEAQAVKNPAAKSAKAVRCLQAEHKLCITGTPMENHLGELWSLFDFLMPGFLGARDQFTRFYRTPIEKHNNKQQSKKLQKRVAPFMLRRNKDLVAKELPPKTEIIRTTELNGKQRDLYETIRASMEAKVKSEIEKKGLARSQIIILDALLKMRQVCCDPSLVKLEQAKEVEESAKLDLLMSLVQPIVEEGRKILIFSQFTSMLLLIEKRLKNAGIDWVKLTGQTRDRNQPIQDFQNGDTPVFLISLKAGGTGLNLTAADTVIHYDPWWNPAVEDQASDRAHRIGQDKPVFIYKLVTEGTVEEKIQELKEKKKAIAASLYGESSAKKKQSLTADDLNVLFEPIKAAEDPE